MRLRYLGVIVLLLFPSVALGDGCYIPEQAVRKIPDIVAQDAVLSWKDGVETLVISSALDSEAQKLGWIIPVPAVPNTIEKTTPGALKTLDFCIQPRITHDLSEEVRTTLLAFFVCNLLLATWVFKRKRFADLVLLIFLLFLLSGLLLSAGGVGSEAAAKTSAVQVEKTATVGSYTISILRPSRPDGLDGWLAGNGFGPLPKAAGPIIADYISKGWVFAAIKLTRGESGSNAPHPIKLTFAAKEPVFPMKLTAIAGGKPEFELFVIANDRAVCDMLEEAFCDRFSIRVDKEWNGNSDETHTRFVGTTTRCTIGHPGICPLMWGNCVLTKFAGSISAASMTKDIRFAWKPFESHQEHFFTQYGARCLAVILFVWGVGLWCLISMLKYREKLVQPQGLRWYLGKQLLPAVALSAIGAGALFTILPKIGNSDVQLSRTRPSFDWWLRRDCEKHLSDHPQLLGRTESEIASFLLQEVRKIREKYGVPVGNMTTWAELKVEDSPGNLTVEKHADKVIVRIYNRNGTPFVYAFPIEATGKPGPVQESGRGSQH